MCIIIHKPAGKILPDKLYQECWSGNSDGVGFAYVDPDKKRLVVEKGFMLPDKAIEAIKNKQELELLIHFRKISKGVIGEENCHPFIIQSKWGVKTSDTEPRFTFVVAHNGTLKFRYGDQITSDTRDFVEGDLSSYLNDDPFFFDRKLGVEMFEAWVETKNKMVIWRFDKDSQKLDSYIINENAGQANKSMGCWFSNYSWLPASDHEWRGAFYRTNTQTNGHMGYHGGGATPFNVGSSEGFADHLGWWWDNEIGMFRNLNNETIRSTLSWRKPLDNEYTHEGKKYNRHGCEKPTPAFRTGAAPNQLALDAPKPSEEDRKIEVPRDADAADADEWDVEISILKAIRSNNTAHLTKKERRRLVRAAHEYVKDSFGDDAVKNISQKALISFYRGEFRKNYESGMNAKTIQELDKAILDHEETPDDRDDDMVPAGARGMD